MPLDMEWTLQFIHLYPDTYVTCWTSENIWGCDPCLRIELGDLQGLLQDLQWTYKVHFPSEPLQKASGRETKSMSHLLLE